MVRMPTTAMAMASNRRRKAARMVKKRGQRETIETEAVVSKEDKDFIEGKMKQYDKDGSGALDKGELMQLLKDLNDGIPPSDDELTAIILESDADKSGKIDANELRKLLVVWFANVEEDMEEEYCVCTLC